MARGAGRAKGLGAALALSCLVASSARAAPYRAPPLSGHVVDPAGLLGAAERLSLDEQMEGIRKQKGLEVVAFLVDSLEQQPIEDVAYAAFNQWGIGRAGKDNGVLLVIAPKERKVRIETGKGVGGALTDLQVDQIIRDRISPSLRADRFAQAIGNGVDAIAATYGASQASPAAGEKSPLAVGTQAPAAPNWVSVVVLGIGLALVILLLIVSSGFRTFVWAIFTALLLFGRRGGGGGGQGSGYSGGGGSSGGGGASGSY